MARTAAISRSKPDREGAAIKVYELFLGYACDEKCLFCSQPQSWRAKPGPDFPALASKVYAAFQRGSRILAVNGGEPTVYRDLAKIIAFARRVGYPEIHLQSNGVRLGDAEYASALASAGLTLARLSIHGHTEALHDSQVLRPGAFRKAIRAIGNLRAAGVSVGINTVISRLNASALPEIYRWFLDATLVRDFGLIFPLFEGDMAAQLERTKVSMSEAAPSIRAAFEEFRKRGAEPPFLLNLPPCVLPGYESRVLRWSNDGAAIYDSGRTMIIDPESYVLEHPGEAPKGLDSASREGKAKTPACSRCVYDGRCLGFEARYEGVFGDAEFRPLAKEPERFDADWGSWTSGWRRVLTSAEHAELRA